MSKKEPKLRVVHNIGSMKCKVLGCENLAEVAYAVGWAPTIGDTMELMPVCSIHSAEMEAAYKTESE